MNPQHLSKVIAQFVWAVFCGLLAWVFYSSLHYHWGVWVYLAFAVLMCWRHVKATWTLWLYGRYQYRLQLQSQTPSGNYGRARFPTLEDLEEVNRV